MAGDVKETQSGDVLATPNYADPFPGILDELQNIRDLLRGVGKNAQETFAVGFPLTLGSARDNFATMMWQRLHIAEIVLNPNAAGTAGIQIGTRVWLWNVAGAGPIVIPFYQTIERGTDVTIPAAASAQDEPLLITGTPE